MYVNVCISIYGYICTYIHNFSYGICLSLPDISHNIMLLMYIHGIKIGKALFFYIYIFVYIYYMYMYIF